MEEILENKEYCTACVGYCCKKCGCDYYPEDFKDLSFNGLTKILSEGNISIVAALDFQRMPKGNLVYTPLLYLRARNIDRDIVDLVSIKKTCSMLREDGCSYDFKNRPSAGANLIPATSRFECHPKIAPTEYLRSWESYQKVLTRFVKRYCGMSLEYKLKEDIENLFYECLSGVLDTVPIEEKYDVEYNFLPNLLETSPLEYEKAYKRYKEKGLSKKLNYPSDKRKQNKNED